MQMKMILMALGLAFTFAIVAPALDLTPFLTDQAFAKGGDDTGADDNGGHGGDDGDDTGANDNGGHGGDDGDGHN